MYFKMAKFISNDYREYYVCSKTMKSLLTFLDTNKGHFKGFYDIKPQDMLITAFNNSSHAVPFIVFEKRDIIKCVKFIVNHSDEEQENA